jgi:hypothetical protein
MASTGFVFNSVIRDEAIGGVNYSSDTFKCLLLTSSATPNKDTWTRRNNITNEVTGAGYTAGGVTVTVSVGSVDTTNDRVDISLGTAEWTASTLTARYAVYYKARGGASSADELIAVVDFGQDVSTINDTFSLTASTLRKSNP